MKVTTAALLLTSVAKAQNLVKLELYVESGCPSCQEVLSSSVNATVTALASILDVHFYPFGNAYWPQEDCPPGATGVYDHDERVCWQAKCGVDEPPLECNEGDLLCQHGPNECLVNAVEACVMKLYPDPLVYIPFAACAEKSFPVSEPCAVDVFGLDWEAIDSCSTDPAQVRAMAITLGHATAIAKPEGTPTVVVNGVTLNDPNLLFLQVCRAYAGPDKPPSCYPIEAKFPDDLPLPRPLLLRSE